jgi:hypothetical protein
LHFNDKIGQEDFYYAVAGLIYKNENSGSLEEGKFRYIPDNGFLDDKGKDGGRIEYKRGEFSKTFNGRNNITLKFIELNIMNCEENFYRYHKTTSAYNDQPFTEPVFVHNNINGGLGCFGAYRLFFKQIEL